MKSLVWKKRGILLPVTGHDLPWWSKEYYQAPNSLLLEDRVRVFFCSRTKQDINGQYVSRAGYCDFSIDGNFNFLGFSPNPLIGLGARGAFDEFGTYPLSIFKEGATTWGVYAGWTRLQSVPFDVSLGLVKSNDNGTSFHKVQDEPILTKSVNEPYIISSPKLRKFQNTWFLYYISGEKWKFDGGRYEPVYKIRLATSMDLRSWKRCDKNIITSVLPDEAQASPDVFEFNGSYHMYFCYRHTSKTKELGHGYRIGYAQSYNLVDWVRDDSSAGIDLGPDDWDCKDMSYPNFISIAGKHYLLYLGNEVGKFHLGIAELDSTHDA
jgi:hypothetical protein